GGVEARGRPAESSIFTSQRPSSAATRRARARQMLASVFRVVLGAQVVATYDTGIGSRGN
ncbi:hypothetical protein LCGC14_2376350, partial [marine sediment metagenome]